MIGGPIIDFVNLFGLAWLSSKVGYVAITRFLIWILFFALFQGVLTSNASPSFISGKKRIAMALSIAISLLVSIGMPGSIITSLLSGFGILGAAFFVVAILAGFTAIIRKIPEEGEEEHLAHIVAKFFMTVVLIAVISAFQAAASLPSGGMPPGVVNSFNEILEWAILLPTIYLFYLLYRMITIGDRQDNTTEEPESNSAATRRRTNRFKFVESRLLKARELLEQAESSAGAWDTESRAKTERQLRGAHREVHAAWTQLRRVRRSDRETRDMANNFAARMQVYENMINDLIAINARRPKP